MTFVSIITSTLNAESTLVDCLESVKQQTEMVEHILVDGGSTDSTLAIAEKYGTHLSRIISGPDRGMYDAMNKGIQLAEGDVIGILNGDDFYPSVDTLKKVAAVFDDKQVQACYGDLLYVDEVDTDRIVRHWRSGEFTTPRQFYWGWMPPHPTFFVRRSVYERYGLFNPELGSAADYELMLRFLVRYTINTVYIPKILVRMRTGGVSNASWQNRIRANRMDRKAWQINRLRPYPWTLWLKPLRKVGQWVVAGKTSLDTTARPDN